MRNCGCDDRGRHKRTCQIHIQRKEKEEVDTDGNVYKPYKEGDDKNEHIHNLFIRGYGKPAYVEWYPSKTRQSTVENRIKRYVKRYKAFYLTTNSLDKDSNQVETWYVDGGNWVYKKDGEQYNILVGHVKNCLPFLDGRQPLWKKRVY